VQSDPGLRADERQELITQGSIPKTFFILAGPAIATMSMEFILHLTDMIWVGRIGGPVPVAIVTSSMFSLWIVWSLISVLTVGTVAIVSRYFGAKDYGYASYASSQAVGLGLITGVLVTIIGVTAAPLAFMIMSTSPEVTAGGVIYLRIQFSAALLFIMVQVVGSIFRATGDTKTPMLVSFVAVGINIILDPILIFGWGPFPRMETTGAALASAVAITMAGLVYLIVLRTGKLSIDLNLSAIKKPDIRLGWRITKIGMPLSIAGVLFSLVYFFINRIATEFGDVAVAALGIGNRCESISYLICFGASQATATMVGQNLGAGKPDRAEKSGWLSLFYTGIFTGIIMILFLTIPETIARIFIDDMRVIPNVKNYLIIIGISQIFMASEIVMEGAFSGAGDTLPPMLVGISWSLLRIPLAYILSFPLGFGVDGIWWVISGTSIIKGIIIAAWFRRGKWKLKNV
jgi:putative MATE family efflux protein